MVQTNFAQQVSKIYSSIHSLISGIVQTPGSLSFRALLPLCFSTLPLDVGKSMCLSTACPGEAEATVVRGSRPLFKGVLLAVSAVVDGVALTFPVEKGTLLEHCVLVASRL